MSYESYKISRTVSSSKPREVMLYAKRKQVESLFRIAMDREDNCTLNNTPFIEEPRIFNRRSKLNYFQLITIETVIKEDYFQSGDVVKFEDHFWICIFSSVFHGLYCKGDFIRANYMLQWQSDDGSIITEPCWLQSAAQYNTGEISRKTMSLGNDQLMIVLPSNSNTILLDTPTSFFIDSNTVFPTPYKITRNDSIPYSDWDKGCINLIVTERPINKNDRIDLMLCDYQDPSNLPTDNDSVDTYGYSQISYKSDPSIKLGNFKQLSSQTFDDYGNKVNSIDLIWDVFFDDESLNECITLTTVDINKVRITISDNKKLISQYLNIITYDSNNNYHSKTEKLKVVMSV